MFEYFYHEILRKTIISFGTLFNGIAVKQDSQEIRVPLAYGPKQDINRFLPVVISGCIKNKKFPCSNGNQLRDFVHVKDVVNAIFKSLKNKKAVGEIINLGSGKPKKIKILYY